MRGARRTDHPHERAPRISTTPARSSPHSPLKWSACVTADCGASVDVYISVCGCPFACTGPFARKNEVPFNVPFVSMPARNANRNCVESFAHATRDNHCHAAAD